MPQKWQANFKVANLTMQNSTFTKMQKYMSYQSIQDLYLPNKNNLGNKNKDGQKIKKGVNDNKKGTHLRYTKVDKKGNGKDKANGKKI